MSAAAAYCQRLGTEASAAWDRFWFMPASPVPLARLRIAIGLIALAYFLSWTADLSRMFSADGLLAPGPVQQLLHERADGRVHYHVSPLFSIDSPAGLYAYHGVSIIVALLLTCGVFTRTSCLLTLLAVLMHVHRAPMLTSPLETVLVFLLLYMLIGPTGAAFSFDAWRSAKSGQSLTAPSWIANISLRLLQVHLAGFIWLVACSLLASPVWWNGTALWALEAQELSRPLNLSWLRDVPKLVNGWTHLFVLINLLFPILVWNRLLRPLVVALGIIAWSLMIPLTGQTLYVLAVITAMCAFLTPAAPEEHASTALAE
jgi:hypothetical protein